MNAQSKNNYGNGWEVTVAKNFQQVEGIRSIWQEMQSRQTYPVPNAEIDRYICVLESQDNQVRPHVMLFRLDNKPVTMLVGRMEKHQLNCRIGYKTICNPKLLCLTIVYGGILGICDDRTSTVIMRELLSTLRSGEADMVWFNQLRTDMELYKYARRTPSFLCRNYYSGTIPHWQTCLSNYMNEADDTMSSIRKRKRYLKRYTKALEKACSAPVEMVYYNLLEDIDVVISIAQRISSITYKRGLNVGFDDNATTRSLLSLYAGKRWLRAYVLYAGGEPCAFEFGIKYGKNFFPEYIGYDPQLRSCSPGTVLFMKVLEDLANDSGLEAFDYGFGDAVYKHRFGTRCWPETCVYIFAPRLYPILVNMCDSSIRGMSSVLDWLVSKSGFYAKIKKYWRELLRRKQNN